MSFSKEWDKRFKENTHMSIWPWSNLVSYVMRYAKPDKPKFKVLELGCGFGANVPFFESLKVTYYAIEGSETIVKKLHQKYPHLKGRIKLGDFTRNFYFEQKFDLIVDRSALTHNSTVAIKKGIENIYKHLSKNGRYIGIDWFSTNHSEYQNGMPTDDIYTRTNYTEGNFANVGRVHFSDKAHLLDLFHQFEIIVMEHNIVKREIPDEDLTLAFWNLVAMEK